MRTACSSFFLRIYEEDRKRLKWMCKKYILHIVYIFALCTKRRRNIDEEQRCDICGCGDCRGFCTLYGSPVYECESGYAAERMV